jgi:hypothetical protein
MKRIVLLSGVLCAAMAARADVKTQEKNQVHFAGMMGRLMGMFGGRAAREGVVDTIAVRGSRKMTVNDTTGRIIDLDEEKVYELDMRAKTYHVVTFDEMRRRMQEAEQKARSSEPTQPSGEPKTDPNAKQMQIDFDLKESGEKKNLNGYDCREVIMTITVHEKGKTLEESGGMVMTTHEWLGPRIPAMKEINDFDRRYSEKLNGSFAMVPSAEQMAAAMAMYPMMKDAIGKFQAENVNMDGTPILTVMSMESVAGPEQMQRQQQQQKSQASDSSTTNITSVGGLLGGLGRRAVRKRAEQQQQKQQENATPGRATIMTMNHELVKVLTDVTAADVAIPAGFKQK